MRFSVFLLFLILTSAKAGAQHKGYSYELQNEIGSFKLVSFTVKHSADNSEGTTYVLNKYTEDTVYQIDEYLNGWVGLSSDGSTVAHLISEENGKPLKRAKLAFYRGGKLFDKVEMSKLINYHLEDAKRENRLSKKGWLKNDSVLTKMAENPFFVTEDKLYISFSEPKLTVFDMKRMFHIYTGNGANHFTQNYYSIPNAPFRTHFDWGAYLPDGFPGLTERFPIESRIAENLVLEEAIPEEAVYRASIELKLYSSGQVDVRQAEIFEVATNKGSNELSKALKVLLDGLDYEVRLIPPGHPAWVFNQNFWFK